MNYIKKEIEINENVYEILIGKNAYGNEEIIKMSDNDDLWFHINNLPSAHLILKCKEKISKRDLYKIGNILLDHNKKVPRNSNIIYTKVKNIKLTNKLGSVITKNTELLKM